MDLTQTDDHGTATSYTCREPSNQDEPATGVESASILSGIEEPTHLRARPESDLPGICRELRETLISSVSDVGGHLGANLGVIELTVALHYIFDTPADRLIWDIGHQSYPHKMLSGRRESLARIRQLDGISGFPVINESEYDSFGAAHAGNSVSAGLGMAMGMARTEKQNDSRQHVVCVLGDGALTEGMVFEALNHAGSAGQDLIIVLNDNRMSISPNVGALAESDGDQYASFFESLGCDYAGPIDGHDVHQLIASLRTSRQGRGVQVLHVLTQKGKGYERAEKDPVAYHAVPVFNADLGVQKSSKKSAPTYTTVFGKWACDTAQADPRVAVITPAMKEGSGLVEFAKRFPDQFHDVAIAEQHAVTFAAGLACENQKPVVAIYSTFLQRAYDQFIHDVALQDLDVLFAIDRCGLVGNDGATHHGSFDASFLRCIPNLVLMAPADERECRQMLQTGLEHPGPAAVRYERGNGPGIEPESSLNTLPIGKAHIVRKGHSIALLAFGSMVQSAQSTADALDATLVNMRFIKPMDEQLIAELCEEHTVLVTIENNVIAGGAGSAVNEAINRLQAHVSVLNLGLPDTFAGHGTQLELLQECQLDSAGIMLQVLDYVLSLDAHRAATPPVSALSDSRPSLHQLN